MIYYENSNNKQKQYIESRINNEIYVRANELGNNISYEDIENLFDPETEECKEIYQWYIISEYLYNALSEIEEPVAYYKDLYFWGRTYCGQSISLDPTFWKIFQEGLL